MIAGRAAMTRGDHFKHEVAASGDGGTGHTRPLRARDLIRSVHGSRLQEDERRRIHMHLTQLVDRASNLYRIEPSIDHAVMRVPTTVGRKQRNFDADLARKSHQRGEVRVADLRVQAAPVVLDSNGDDWPRRPIAAAVARCLQVDKLICHPTPKPADAIKKRWIRLAYAIAGELADPSRQSSAGERPAHARPNSQRNLEPGRPRRHNRVAHRTIVVERKSPRSRLMDQPRHSDDNAVEPRLPQLRQHH